MITYLKGDATEPDIKNSTMFIVHMCNDVPSWGAGFVLAVSKKWKKPEKEYWKLSKYKLGTIKTVCVDENNCLNVINMTAQHRIGRYGKVSYNHLEKCLNDVYNEVHDHINPTVHMPRIGCGLGKGRWSVVEGIIKKTLKDIPVYVYDLK